MSVTGSGETHRAYVAEDIPAGGVQEDVRNLQASEDRRIVGFQIDDTGGSANVGMEFSFKSSTTIGSAATPTEDENRASVIGVGFQGQAVMGLSITWNAGEEVHIHAVNNSGAEEEVHGTIYYEEL